jgi:hypothetical protein
MLLVSSEPVGNRRRVIVLALGALIFLAGWGVLVWFAVVHAKDKEWGSVAVGAVGAAASLFVALLLWTQSRAVGRGESPARSSRAPRAPRAPRHKPSHRA